MQKSPEVHWELRGFLLSRTRRDKAVRNYLRVANGATLR